LYNRIAFGTTKLNLFSVHLSTFKDERILACKELLNIASNINKGERIIIGGDFNVGISKEGKHQYAFKQREEYEEYLLFKEKFNRIDNVEDTWFSGDQSACIDTFFYSKNLRLSKFETIKSDISDHYALYAEFIV
jgi:endonuclease/exonuclease/phosphatase family metal-dependent hydrolase